MNYTQYSLNLTQEISDKIKNQTFHHHYHILYDIANSYSKDYLLTYVEIGCFAGGSACLLLQRPNTKVISIDLGYPIPKEIVYQNVENLNIFNNNYYYLQGNSQTHEVVNSLKNITNHIDILFIDGDHSYQGVINDFLLYENLINPKGYIIFDDYNDIQCSPQVKIAVDDIISTIKDKYKIIGTLPNIYEARPSHLKEGNCFIIQKI
jgi:predicted O-methyltransferase YrrM